MGNELNTSIIDDEIINFSGLDDNKQLQKIDEMRKDLQESIKKNDDQEDPDKLLYKNIERANGLLDKLEDYITDKEKRPKDSIARLFEVSCQLINAVTQASASIAGGFKDEFDQEYKLELLALENKKLAVKYALGGGQKPSGSTPQTVNNNLIVANREQILDLIKKEGDN